jgi:DNA polymerase II large subunit
MEKYFKKIEESVRKCYSVAEEARKKGFDPVDKVEIPLARNMAERVEGLISAIAPQIKNSGIVERIMELEKDYGVLDWRVALAIALEVAQQKFCKFESKKEAMEVGIRVGFAYVTVGVVASPLEGFVELKLNKRKDGKKYFCLMFSGPIRSAGGTGASVCVLIADYVRNKMGYAIYDPTEDEINRTLTEVENYHERVTNLQYYPSKEELRFLAKNLPVQINGDPSENIEVSNYKDLERIETNRLRNGFCLVMAECLAQKSPKLKKQLDKWGKDFDMKDWNFLSDFIKIQKKSKAGGKGVDEKIVPDYTYIKDLVAGRPVLTHPLRIGGFRLRYGRCRNSGFSSNAIHPATMIVLNNFIAIGTQLKIERPGKATSIALCDSIEGPIVKLKNGSVMFLDTEEQAKKYIKEIDEILFLGDMLINYGDFLNRAHRLVPCGYNEDWYRVELKSKGCLNTEVVSLSFDDCLKLSQDLGVPLHPRYTFHWKDINKNQLKSLLNWFKKADIEKDRIILPFVYDISKDVEGHDPKRVLELLGVPHKVVEKECVVVEGDFAKAFVCSLGLDENDVEYILIMLNGFKEDCVLKFINSISKFKIRDKSGTFIGARMGRPEKAKMRKLTGSPQVLFPVGVEGGRLRCFQSALEKGKVTGDFPLYYCEKCLCETICPVCEKCNSKTKRMYYCGGCKKNIFEEKCSEHGKVLSYKRMVIDINSYYGRALKKLKIKNPPELVKGVRGTSNEDHTPENLVKGILRAKHNIYVNKEGTVRYDMTETTLTAFKPKEIGVSIGKLNELGYTHDIYGNKLVKDDQIVELKVQDVVLPSNEGSDEEGADDVLFRVGNFIDDLLKNFYGLSKFYNFKDKHDLIGQLVVAMSPHTSAGAVARIIGFSKTQGFYAHPMLHSLLRRDCDGDESCVILLMDALLNFSRKYLPAHRGAVQDAPLVLTYKLIPTEVDDMVFDMDIVQEYPLELYKAAMEYKYPWDIKIKTVNDILNTDNQYSGYFFTHDVGDINNGVKYSAYKGIPTMQEKVQGQMELAEKIRAVDEVDVARLILERHFIRDIKGNLRKFSIQRYRCVDCNQKFRRPPLLGRCGCGGKIIFTIAEGSVVKYLEPSLQIAERYSLPPYLKQTLELTKDRIEGVFGKEKEKQEGLVKWF